MAHIATLFLSTHPAAAHPRPMAWDPIRNVSDRLAGSLALCAVALAIYGAVKLVDWILS